MKAARCAMTAVQFGWALSWARTNRGRAPQASDPDHGST